MSLDEILNAGIKTGFEELTQLAAYIEDKDAVIEVAKVISKYNGDAARDIARGLKDIAMYGDEGSAFFVCIDG